MTLPEVLDAIFATDHAISRPALCDDRNSYITYEGEHLPMKLRRFNMPLQTDWVPSPKELIATDWFVVPMGD